MVVAQVVKIYISTYYTIRLYKLQKCTNKFRTNVIKSFKPVNHASVCQTENANKLFDEALVRALV